MIVVGVDGSAASIVALRHAKYLAEKQDAQLKAVSVWTTPIAYTPFVLAWSPGEYAESQLVEASHTVFGPDLPGWYERRVIEGSAARDLVKESRSADLLIVGSRGHGGFAGLVLGSVSAQCAAHAHCPVMIIRDSHTVADDQGDAPIIVGHDGSQNADDALEWALTTAEILSSPVTVVRTWNFDRIPPQFSEEFGYVSSFEEVTGRVQRDLIAETLDQISTHPTVEVSLVASLAQPAEALITASTGARMTVVGSRGHGGFAGLVLGSVSAECAAHAHSPVVIVPRRDSANPTP
ncbi:hypothetical protein ASE64_03365 [Agreia sp. Leaf210]|nr:hypothetical protein ASE64_03365 [Agreia sp. Leaf210]